MLLKNGWDNNRRFTSAYQRFISCLLRFAVACIDTAFVTVQLYITKNQSYVPETTYYVLLRKYNRNHIRAKNSLQFGAGYQHTHLLDKQASPLLYQTNEQLLTADFEHEIAGAAIQVHLDGAIGSLFPKGLINRQFYNPGFNPDGSHINDSALIIGTFYNARLQFGYSKTMSKGYRRLFGKDVFSKKNLGASLSDQLFYTDNIVRAGWLNSLSLNAQFEHNVVFDERHIITAKVAVPVMALNTRLPYHNSISSPSGDSEYETFFKQGTRVASLADYQNIQVSAAYQYKLNKRWGVGVSYFGQWLHYKYQKPINLYQNRFSFTTSFHY